MLYRLHYSTIFYQLQTHFGREYSQLSRIFKNVINYVYDHHKNKIHGNIEWYRNRFDAYNVAINTKIGTLNVNPNPGTVPVNLNNICGFIDCTAEKICRPHGNDNAQNPFFNKYHHGHFLIWQIVTFPDGNIVLQGPEPGFYTDLMVWRDCEIRPILENIMADREATGQRILKFYTDKIYTTIEIITAAWSRRFGEVLAWMTTENDIMSCIRISVEWSFSDIFKHNKYVQYFRGQQIQSSPVQKYYVVASLLWFNACNIL